MHKSLLPALSIVGMASFIFGFVPHAVWSETVAPMGYTPITWVGEPGINSFIKVPDSAGYIDYITIIDLTKNQVKLMSTSSPRVLEGPAVQPFANEEVKNWLFTRSIVESLKAANPEAKFIWNAPFFNVNMSTTILSLGLKSSDTDGPYITSGGRPANDIAEARRMLILDNKTGLGKITDFNETVFVHEGDQAVEGFHPLGSPSSKSEQAARVYLGIRNGGKELVVYCSKSASKAEASNALASAGVPVEQQIQVDGGGSATCGYNLPGQYFVEPGRALPHLMGAMAVQSKGAVTINNLNVRSGPGANNSSVRKLALGTTVTIYEEKNGWVRISRNEWVSKQYIKMVKILPYSAVVKTNELNVRKGSGASFPSTRRLQAGTTVTVYEEKNGWVRISDTEWVSGSHLQ